MRDLKVIGKIISISDIQTFQAGSQKITFRIDTGEEYNNIVEFELFKSKDYVEHIKKFNEYNKIGDRVEVTFSIKTNHYQSNGKDSVFTSLSCWRVDKLDSQTQPQETQQEDDLPF